MTKRNVDILLVNPGSPAAVYQELSNQFSAFEPPSLAALFATYIRLKGGTVDIVDIPVNLWTPEEAASHIQTNYNPILIVMVVYGFQPSASTQNMTAAGETCTALKQLNPNYKILMTGTHPAALPARTMREEATDFVCSQECPQTIWETFKVLKAGGGDFSSVPSLWYRDGSETLSTPTGPLLDDLDAEMPCGAWDLF